MCVSYVFVLMSTFHSEEAKLSPAKCFIFHEIFMMCTASILGFPSKEIQGKPHGNLQKISNREILTLCFPDGNLQYLFLLFPAKEIHRRFSGLGKAAVLRTCRFSWGRKSNNSGSDVTFSQICSMNIAALCF